MISKLSFGQSTRNITLLLFVIVVTCVFVTLANFSQNDESGVFMITFQDDLSGIDVNDSGYFSNTGSQLLIGQNNEDVFTPGYIVTSEVTPASFSVWDTIEVQGDGSSSLNLELLNCEGELFEEGQGVPVELLGVLTYDTSIDISGINPGVVDCLQVRLSSDEQYVIDSIRLSWNPLSIAEIKMQGPESLEAGTCDQYQVSWSVSYVDKNSAILYVDDLPFVQDSLQDYSGAYEQFTQGYLPYLGTITNDGIYTTGSTTLNGIEVPANSIYWEIGSADLGSSYLYNFEICTVLGTQNDVNYDMTAKIVGSIGTQVESNNISTTITSTPEPEVNLTVSQIAFPASKSASGNIANLNAFVANGKNAVVATEDMFNPISTIYFEDAFTVFDSACSLGSGVATQQERVILPTGFIWIDETTAQRGFDLATTGLTLDSLFSPESSMSEPFSIDLTGCSTNGTAFDVVLEWNAENTAAIQSVVELSIYDDTATGGSVVTGGGGSACGSQNHRVSLNGHVFGSWNHFRGTVPTQGGDIVGYRYALESTNGNYTKGRAYNAMSFLKIPEGYEVVTAIVDGAYGTNSPMFLDGNFATTPSNRLRSVRRGNQAFINSFYRQYSFFFHPDGSAYLRQFFTTLTQEKLDASVLTTGRDSFKQNVDTRRTTDGFNVSRQSSPSHRWYDYEVWSKAMQTKLFYHPSTTGSLNQPPSYDTSSMFPVTEPVSTVQLGNGWTDDHFNDAGWLGVFTRCVDKRGLPADPSSVCYGKPDTQYVTVFMRQKDYDTCSMGVTEQVGHYSVYHGYSTASTNADANVIEETNSFPFNTSSCPFSVQPSASPMLMNNATTEFNGDETYECGQSDAAKYTLTFASNEYNGTMGSGRITIQLPTYEVNQVFRTPMLQDISVAQGDATVTVDENGLPLLVDNELEVIVHSHEAGQVIKIDVDLQRSGGFRHNTEQVLTGLYINIEDFCDEQSYTLAKSVTLTCTTKTPNIHTKKYLDMDVIGINGGIEYVIESVNNGDAYSQDTFVIDVLPKGVVFDGIYVSGSIDMDTFEGSEEYPLQSERYQCDGCSVYFTDEAVPLISSTSRYVLDTVTSTSSDFDIAGYGTARFVLGTQDGDSWSSPFGESTTAVVIKIDHPDVLLPDDVRSFGIRLRNQSNQPGDIIENQVGTLSLQLIQNISNTVETTILGQSVKGTIYYDADLSGEYSEDIDTGLENIIVTATGYTTNGEFIELSTSTDNGGHYAFNDIPEGNYQLSYENSTQYFSMVVSVGSVGGNTIGVNTISNIDLVSGLHGIAYDFGLWDIIPASIAGTIYLDNNSNQDYLGDNGIQGLLVILLNESGIVIDRTITDDLGTYVFDMLTPGTYSVSYVNSSNYIANSNATGSLGGEENGFTEIAGIIIDSGDEGIQYDFGLVPQKGSSSSVLSTNNFVPNPSNVIQTVIEEEVGNEELEGQEESKEESFESQENEHFSTNEDEQSVVVDTQDENKVASIEQINDYLEEIQLIRQDKTAGIHYFEGEPRFLKTGRSIDQGIGELGSRIIQNDLVQTVAPNRGIEHEGDEYPKSLDYWLKNVLLPYDSSAIGKDMYVLFPRAGYLVPVEEMDADSLLYNKMISGDEIDVAQEMQEYFARGAVHHAGSVRPGERGRALIAMHTSWFKDKPGEYIEGEYPTIGQLLFTLEKGDPVHVFVKEGDEYVRYDYSTDTAKVVEESEIDFMYPGVGKELMMYGCTPIGTAKQRIAVVLRMEQEQYPWEGLSGSLKSTIDRFLSTLDEEVLTSDILVGTRKKLTSLLNTSQGSDKKLLEYLLFKVSEMLVK